MALQSNPGTPANPRLRTLAALAALAEILDVSVHDLIPERVSGVADGRATAE